MDHKYAGNLSPSGPLISNGGGIETLSGSDVDLLDAELNDDGDDG
ncbi:unnamed protein product [Brassica oleracea var. botrytis]|uniref:Uncharacterized protein n=2 Tax=Brassica TaxID=3705 RepID=A0A3P6EMW2_BRAOL|nr:unnamed protein product [Brassica napus]VDD36554.1 unnamed protein product [Brassica oleracea]